MSGVERLTNQLAWLFQQKLGFPVPAQMGLSEHFVLLKLNMISDNVVASPGQFMSQSIMSNTGIGLVQFSVIEVRLGPWV